MTGRETASSDTRGPTPDEIDEVGAFVATLLATPAHRLTACQGWTVHELVAHLTAGAAEEAALIEAHLEGRPDRATEDFASRERPYRQLPDAQLRDRLFEESVRLATGISQLGEETVLFTGRRMSGNEFAMHSRSECALHRWDVTGRDDIGWAMLSQPALTTHAIKVLTTMAALPEAPGNRVGRSRTGAPRVVLRSAPHDDIVLNFGPTSCDIEQEPIGHSIADVELDPAQRLLMLWGRREPGSPIDLHAEGPAREVIQSLLAR